LNKVGVISLGLVACNPSSHNVHTNLKLKCLINSSIVFQSVHI